MTDTELRSQLENLQAALRGTMLVGLSPEQVLKIAAVQVEAILKRLPNENGVPTHA